jgi:hypothetical protein
VRLVRRLASVRGGIVAECRNRGRVVTSPACESSEATARSAVLYAPFLGSVQVVVSGHADSDEGSELELVPELVIRFARSPGA